MRIVIPGSQEILCRRAAVRDWTRRDPAGARAMLEQRLIAGHLVDLMARMPAMR